MSGERAGLDGRIGYFAQPTRRWNYAEGWQAGRFLGSGQVEGEGKTLGLRRKRRGVRGNKRNVQARASLVCVRHPSQWDAYGTLAR